MLQQFTWQQFLIAALILTLIWYLLIFVLFYRHKITVLFSKQQQPERLQREWEEELQDEPEEETLMGRPRQAEGLSSVSMDAFRFAPKNVNNEQNQERRMGIVPDVLEDLKSIFQILEKEEGTKQDFISLFTLVSSKYPQIKGTSSQQALNDHIRENLPFEISQQELDRLWI